MNRSPWFSAEITPDHPGPYECERDELVATTRKRKPRRARVIRMLNWDGEHWRYGEDVPNAQCKPGMPALMMPQYGDRWRGVTEQQP